MSLSAELARPLPRVPRPILPKRKSLLETEADKAAQAFGGIVREVLPPRDVIAQVELALGADGSGLSGLTRKELKVVPYLIWGVGSRWRADIKFVGAYLENVAVQWPNGVRRLWRHFTLNFDAGDPVTEILARWLAERRLRIPDPLRQFSDHYRLFELSQAPTMLATAALSGPRLTDDMESIGLTAELVRTSALGVSILAAAGHQLAVAADVKDAPVRLAALLGGKPNNALAQAVCSEPSRARALRSLVDGLVQWQEREALSGGDPEPVLDLLLALNGDPRFQPDRWHGRVGPASLSAVEGWLSRKTIEAFFRVIGALKTDRPDMWHARRSFWLSYLPYISNAWLIAGLDAIPIAGREGMRFSKFDGGGVQADHCGLMMQIKGTCIMEMNKNGRAVFWSSGARNLPGLFADEYSRSLYLNSVDGRTVFALTHQGEWQRKFRDRIVQMTGIAPR